MTFGLECVSRDSAETPSVPQTECVFGTTSESEACIVVLPALFLIALLALFVAACGQKPVPEVVTLTLLDWQYTGETFSKEYEREFQEFTKETGIQLRFLPSEETPQQRL